MIFITGVTDDVALACARELLKAGLGLRILDAEATSLDLLASGAQCAVFDSERLDSIGAALEDVERLCLPACRHERDAQVQIACVAAARRVGIRRIVKVSRWRPTDGGDLIEHQRADLMVEGEVVATPPAWNVVRHGATLQDLAWWSWQSSHSLSSGDAALMCYPADARDIGMVVVDCLVDDDWPSGVEVVTGREAVGLRDVVGHFGTAVVAEWAARCAKVSRAWRPLFESPASAGPPSATDAVVRITGEEPRSLADFADDCASPQ